MKQAAVQTSRPLIGEVAAFDGHKAEREPNRTASGRSFVPSSHSIVENVADIIDIVATHRNVVVLRRPLPRQLESLRHTELAALTTQLTVIFRPGGTLPLTTGAMLPTPLAALVVSDGQRWAQVFADISECVTVGIRINTTNRAMCPRFHVDRVVLRGVMTYVGPGTHYLDNHDVDRGEMGPPSDKSAPIEYGDHLVRVAHPGDLVLLKGEAWPDNAGNGAVHRSPPVPFGVTRLVVTFDALSF